MNTIPWLARFGREVTVSIKHLSFLRIAIALPLLQDATFICSLAWIFYRIWQIYQKPVDELVDLLGLDIPPVPEVSLAGITSDSVLLYWKPSEQYSTSLKYAIQVNGIKVGEFGRSDTSIQVTGLKAGNYYNIRVIATNAASFSTLGPLIRLRTSSSHNQVDDKETSVVGADKEVNESEAAAIRATPSHFDTSSITISQQVIKEWPSSQQTNRRNTSGRRNSPATSTVDSFHAQPTRTSSLDEDESEEAIQRLTEKLDSLRYEQQDLDRQIDEDEHEFKASITNLTKDRDCLKQTLKEREEASADLRRHGNQLDKLNRSAQSRRAAKEKVLSQKRSERQKLKDDINRWENEVVEIHQDVKDLEAEKLNVIRSKTEEVEQIKEQIAEDQVSIRAIEEEIRVKGVQIKEFERERERLSSNDDEKEEGTGIGTETSMDQAWEARAQSMHAQLTSLWQVLKRAELENQQAHERLTYWVSRRSMDPSQYGPLPVADYAQPFRHGNVQRNRQGSSRKSTISSPSQGYASGSLPFSKATSSSPQFATTSPFFNMSNGMTVPLSAEYNLQPQVDPDILTGGGAMSPAANDLLPSNLFRDEDLAVRDSSNAAASSLLCNTDLNPSSSHAGVVTDTTNTRPQTPVTRNSRAGSLLSSPQESLQNLQGYQPPFDSLPGSDRHSVSPVTASYSPNSSAAGNSLATSRLAHFFPALHWQRGKSNTREPPPLGTLKQGQSQSFPRDLEQDGLAPISIRRRRGSHGSWALPVSGMLKRSTSGSDSQEEDHRTTRHVSEKRSRLNFFGPKAQVHGTSALSDNVSSRPSSTYSYDQIYGRQSSDSQSYTGWQVSEGGPSRNSPLSTHWSTTGGPWSRAASQRPSVRHGSTSNLSIGSTPLDTENCGDTDTPPRSEQMPIGTRPLSSQKSGGPRLNPTAPNFKSFFGLGESKKAAKAEKAIERAADKAKENQYEKLEKDDLSSSHEGSSPSHPRLSKDAGSITTSASMADSLESLDHTTSGSAQDNTISSGSKERFIQKFSRKSSSGKFNVPWGKERGGLFFKWNGEPSTPSELDKETSSERHFGKSVDSVASTPQPEKGSRSSLSWPNMRRKSRKGAANTENSNDTVDDSDP